MDSLNGLINKLDSSYGLSTQLSEAMSKFSIFLTEKQIVKTLEVFFLPQVV